MLKGSWRLPDLQLKSGDSGHEGLLHSDGDVLHTLANPPPIRNVTLFGRQADIDTRSVASQALFLSDHSDSIGFIN